MFDAKRIETAADLAEFLRSATTRDLREVYVEGSQGEFMTATIREDTLSDGSTVHNLILAIA